MGMTHAPTVSAEQPPAELVQKAHYLVGSKYQLWRTSMPEYLGNQCMEVTHRLYGLLNCHGIAADIAIGSVSCEQVSLFHCDVKSLRNLAAQPIDEAAPIDVHAWITLGGDSVIDYALPSRLARNHGAPSSFMNNGFCGDATGMAEQMGVFYEPMVVGSQYLALVNSADPYDMLQKLKEIRSS